MDLGKAADTSTASVLAELRAEVESREASLIREWTRIVAWASDHVVSEPEGAATIREGYVDTGLPVAGPGAPLVSEFALMEVVAGGAVERPTHVRGAGA